METNVNYTLAGLFVVVLISAIVFAVIWLSAGIKSVEYSYYEVLMREAVSGLTVDAPVEFNGVNVGTVNNIKISHADPRVVILLLKIQKDTPVTIATRARLGLRALTGIGYILLEDKGTDKRPLVKAENMPYPIIETVPSILVRLDNILTDLSDSFRELTTSFQELLDEDNLKTIKQLLAATKSSAQLLETKTLPLANQAISSIESVSHSIESVSNELVAISGEVKQNPAVFIRGKSPSSKLGPGEK